MTRIAGRVWKFGDNISADDGIIQYSQVPDLGSFDIPALKAMCFATLAPDFPQQVRPGDVVVAGRNFGHHSHPHACVAMKESGVAAVLVESCDSAFIRKALNVGLPVIPCPGITAIVDDGDTLETDLATGAARNARSGATATYRPLAPQMIEVWQAGGLAAALRRRFGGDTASQPIAD
jgi:3-isopropylmalate/(R)-2-methylmalate dehydratase small subunit